MRYNVPTITLTSLLDLLLIVIFAQQLRWGDAVQTLSAAAAAEIAALEQGQIDLIRELGAAEAERRRVDAALAARGGDRLASRERLQLEAVGRYVAFWHVILGDDDTVRIEFGPDAVTDIVFGSRGEFSAERFAALAGEQTAVLVGEPPKGLVLMTVGYTDEATAPAWRALAQGMARWRDDLERDWGRSGKRFHLSEIGHLAAE